MWVLSLTLSAEESPLSLRDACVLGAVQGATEFMPVSSTAHMLLVNKCLHREIDAVHAQVVNAYLNYVQLGTLGVLAVVFWRRWLTVTLGLLGLNPSGWNLFKCLVISIIPAGVVGVFLNHWVQRHCYGHVCLSVALIVGAFFMLAAERWHRKYKGTCTIDALRPSQAFMVGCFQTLAIFPGVSRSMASIVGGYVVGLTTVQAVEFCFLAGFTVQVASIGHMLLKEGANIFHLLPPKILLSGCMVAFVVGLACIHVILKILAKYGLTPFAYYRLIVALAVLVYL